MANAKRVEIYGEIAWNANDDKDVLALIGRLALPVFGLSITFQGEKRVPNAEITFEQEYASPVGTTLMHYFMISGIEAVSWDALVHDVKILNRAGTVTRARAQDVDNGADWSELPIK